MDDATQHDQNQLAIYRTTLRHLIQLAAKFGGEDHLPTNLMHELRDTRAMIGTLKTRLRDQGVAIPDEADDFAPVQSDVQHAVVHAAITLAEKKKIPKILYVVMTLFIMVSVSYVWYSKNHKGKTTELVGDIIVEETDVPVRVYGEIIAGSVNLREGPGFENKVIGNVKAQTKVYVLSTVKDGDGNNWIYIQIDKQETKGWMYFSTRYIKLDQ